MKRILFLTVAVLFISCTAALAQKVGYVKTEKIFEAIPEYKVATEKLDALAKQYQEQVKSELSKVETLYNNYQKQKANLSQNARQAKENEIIEKERKVKELQQSYFGQDGTMQKKSQEFLDPIKERVQKAIDQVAVKGGYSLVIDLSSMQGVVYAKEGDDLSSSVIRLLPTIK